jgi:hypothetical protein
MEKAAGKSGFHISIFKESIFIGKTTASLLPRIKVFSACDLKEQKREWGGRESYLILGSDIMVATGISGR